MRINAGGGRPIAVRWASEKFGMAGVFPDGPCCEVDAFDNWNQIPSPESFLEFSSRIAWFMVRCQQAATDPRGYIVMDTDNPDMPARPESDGPQGQIERTLAVIE